MHELALAENIFELVVEKAESARVLRIRIEVGRWLAVVPEALRFCFEVVAQGSALEGAILEIVEVPMSGSCSFCQWEGKPEGAYPICPRCLAGIELRSGTELRISELEVS